MNLDTKDYIIISLGVILFVLMSVITYFVFGRKQMNTPPTVAPSPVEMRYDYYNNEAHPFLFYRTFLDMGPEAVGQDICMGELPIGSHVTYKGKDYKLLNHVNGTADCPDGKFRARVIYGNKVEYLDPTDNATYLGEADN